jgi:hypothetical protein
VILDTNGNVFGGFTPIPWESCRWKEKADDSLRRFVFMLKNQRNILARRFALNPK